MIFEIISGGEKTDWVGKEWAGLFFPRGKNGPAHSFPGENTDWGEISACYTGSRGSCLNTRPLGRVFKHRPRDPASVNAMKQTCVIDILAYFT